ncbi:carbohydrate-binding module family 1 protein [Collybiopsis luxurians FD-317 M1]|nr:carbohydrate-binding module family 1 protein [Collybiopsis luxurians FD-317 M1]
MNPILTISVALLVSGAWAQSPAWGQCGGIGWAGSTTCVAGYTCVASSPYYSQCIPGNPTPTSSGGSSGTSTSTGPAPTGSQIRSDQDPTYHFYLQNSNGSAVLGPESSSGYFTIGSTISFPGTNGTLYLNLDTSDTSVSYQPVVFGSTAITTDWGLEGDTIIETNPRQLNFLACATSNAQVYSVYLQTGNDNPPGQTCSLTSLHLDCLC